jgi:hypothetical protein
MTKYTLKLVKDSGAFPPAVQTVATKWDNWTLSCNSSRIYSSKITSGNKDSIQSVVKRLQYLNDSIFQHESASDPNELKRREQLNTSVSSCNLSTWSFVHPVDWKKNFTIYNFF